MTVSVTMLQTRLGEDGELWTPAGSPYTASDAFAAFLVSNNLATGTLPQPARNATQAEAAGVHYNNTAAQNTAAFNTALARRGLVSLMTPGQYMVGGPGQGGLLIPTGTTLIRGAGVELILADDSLTPILMNASAWHSTPITLSTGIVYGSGGNGLTGTCNHTGIGLKHPVGSWIAVLGLDPTAGAARAYQGVYQVFAATPDSITYNMIDVPPSGGNSPAGAMIYPADHDIRVISLGAVWDGNDSGQDTTGIPAGDPREHTLHFRNARNVIMSGGKFRRGMSWGIGANNIRDCTFEKFEGDLYGDGLGTAAVLFQGSGGGRNVLVQEVRGQSKDNLVAWSLDASGVYQNHWGGDTHNIRFRKIESTGGNAPIVAIWGNTNYRHHSFEVDGVTGRTNVGGLVTVDCGYAPTSMLNTRGGWLRIKNLDGSCPGAPVTIRSDGDWEKIEVDGVRNSRAASEGVPLVNVLRLTTTQTIKRLDIKNLVHQSHLTSGGVFNRTGPAVAFANSNIDDLRIEGLAPMRLAANVSLIAHTGSAGTIKRAAVTGVAAESAAAGDSFIFSCENTNAGALGKLTLRDCDFVGTSASGGLVRKTATGYVTAVHRDNCTVSAHEGTGIVMEAGTAAATVTTAAVE
jgi:hypothetical protein